MMVSSSSYANDSNYYLRTLTNDCSIPLARIHPMTVAGVDLAVDREAEKLAQL
jgi:hypothetical protein